MKIFVVFVAIIVGLVGLSSATICAKDLRSGGPQNFASIQAMHAENNRGGREYFNFSPFLQTNIDFVILFHLISFLRSNRIRLPTLWGMLISLMEKKNSARTKHRIHRDNENPALHSKQ